MAGSKFQGPLRFIWEQRMSPSEVPPCIKRALGDKEKERKREKEPHGDLLPLGWERWQAVAEGEAVVCPVNRSLCKSITGAGVPKQGVGTKKGKNRTYTPIRSRLSNEKHIYNVQSSKIRDVKFIGTLIIVRGLSHSLSFLQGYLSPVQRGE